MKNIVSLVIQITPSEDSDQIARMRRLIRIFAGRHCSSLTGLEFHAPVNTITVMSIQWVTSTHIFLGRRKLLYSPLHLSELTTSEKDRMTV